VVVGLLHPAAHGHLGGPKIDGNFRDAEISVVRDRDHVLLKFGVYFSGMVETLRAAG